MIVENKSPRNLNKAVPVQNSAAKRVSKAKPQRTPLTNPDTRPLELPVRADCAEEQHVCVKHALWNGPRILDEDLTIWAGKRVWVEGNLIVKGNLRIERDASLVVQGRLEVTGVLCGEEGLLECSERIFAGALRFTGEVECSHNVTVHTDLELVGNLIVRGDLFVGGVARVLRGQSCSAASYILGKLSVRKTLVTDCLRVKRPIKIGA